MDNINSKEQNIDVQIHYYLFDAETHQMDARVHNDCEHQFLLALDILKTYIDNCRKIKAYRDYEYGVINYRIFDVFSLKLADYNDNKINLNQLKKAIEQYKKEFEHVKKEETYKWIAVKHFQDVFKIDSSDFKENFKEATKLHYNLLDRHSYLMPRAAILEMAEYDPEYVREMFRSLYDETQPLAQRVNDFKEQSDLKYHEFKEKKLKSFQNENAISVYLFFRYPEKYYIYLPNKFTEAAKYLEYPVETKGATANRIEEYQKMTDQIWEYAKNDNELLALNQSRITDDCYPDKNNHLLAEDLVYFIYRTCSKQQTDDYWPPLSEYNPEIDSETYKAIMKTVPIDWLDAVYHLYQMGGGATCTQIANKYGNTPMHYSSHCTALSKRVQKETDCPICYGENNQPSYWPVLFQGKENIGNDGTFIWRLRDPLKQALKELIEEDYFETVGEDIMKEYDKNMILYGPPGTGKTYQTIIYAVAIIEGKDISNIRNEDYAEVKKRYDAYKAAGRIVFTTFHQSYGYEDFIEGIRPNIKADTEDEDNNIEYVIEPGVFRRFCDTAQLPKSIQPDENSYGFNKNPNVWKVSLYSTGENPVRTECMKNNHIRIGWDGYGEITDQTVLTSGKAILNAFYNKMQIGDIVLSCYSSKTIDAVGVITGDPEWHPEYKDLKRLRSVKWLVKDIDYSIVDINDGASMTLSTIYKMNITLNDVLQILKDTVKTEVQYEPNRDRYVFIADEINRGNISKIFGELITLIETEFI